MANDGNRNYLSKWLILYLEFNTEPLFELKVAADDMNNTQHIILVIERTNERKKENENEKKF